VLVNTDASNPVEKRGRSRPAPPERAMRPGCVLLLVCAAVSIAGCSNEPIPPQGALWTGSSNARTATATLGTTDSAVPRPAYKSTSGGDWGPYSGRRGQSEPPAAINYTFKGDPNASQTFAAGPGQM